MEIIFSFVANNPDIRYNEFMEKLSEFEKRILLKMYEMDPDKKMSLILKDTVLEHFSDEPKIIRDFLEKMEENGMIKTPPKSFSFHFTPEGIDYCGQFFI